MSFFQNKKSLLLGCALAAETLTASAQHKRYNDYYRTDEALQSSLTFGINYHSELDQAGNNNYNLAKGISLGYISNRLDPDHWLGNKINFYADAGLYERRYKDAKTDRKPVFGEAEIGMSFGGMLPTFQKPYHDVPRKYHLGLRPHLDLGLNYRSNQLNRDHSLAAKMGAKLDLVLQDNRPVLSRFKMMLSVGACAASRDFYENKNPFRIVPFETSFKVLFCPNPQ